MTEDAEAAIRPRTSESRVGASGSRHSPAVTLIRDKRARAWPTHPSGARAHVVSAVGAFTSRFECDAHFAAYSSRVERRLSRAALDAGIEVFLDLAVFDIDCPAAHGTGAPAPEAWRAALLEQFAALERVHPGSFTYGTRGGARIVFALPEPAILRSQEDARQWSKEYAGACAYLERRFGIVADVACCDWQRLYRLPHATRTPGGQPENWPTYGDPEHIGALRIAAARDDVTAARRAKPNLFPSRPSASPAPRRTRARDTTHARVAEVSSGGAACEGLLYHLLRARGDILRPHGPSSWVIRCPNESAHTSGATGDTSTVLYGAAAGGSLGWVCCMHSHCAHFDARSWIEMFDEQELAAARRACVAGVA